MTVEVTYARRPARTSQAESARRCEHAVPQRITEFGRWPRSGGMMRTVAVLNRPGFKPCVAIAHWRGAPVGLGAPAGLILIFEEHIATMRVGIAGSRARAGSSARVDAGVLRSPAGHFVRVFSRPGRLDLGLGSSERRRGLIVLGSDEITALEKALDELARQTAGR